MAKKYHALTAGEKNELRKAGFLPQEIKEWDKTQRSTIDSPSFKSMVMSRRNWRDSMVLSGWFANEIENRLRIWLGKKKEGKKIHSPWDFLDLESGARRRGPKLDRSTFKKALQARADLSRAFGRAYGRIRSVKVAQRKGLPGIPRPRR